MIDKKKSLKLKKNFKICNGFGLADAIVSLSLLAGIITYGVYFSSLRLNTVYSSNLIRSINKEIERDIERLKLDFWSLFYDTNEKKYIISKNDCDDFSKSIINLQSLQINSSLNNRIIESWRPGPERSKVFTGDKILITREITISPPIKDELLNLSIANLNYRVEYGDKKLHWISIDLTPEAHSWCSETL